MDIKIFDDGIQIEANMLDNKALKHRLIVARIAIFPDCLRLDVCEWGRRAETMRTYRIGADCRATELPESK